MVSPMKHDAVNAAARRERSRGPRWARATLALVASTALLAACTAELVPLAPTTDGSVRVERSGIEVQARVESSREYLPGSLTPVQLSVRNLSPQGVYVSLEDIRLVGKGAQLTAIDPIDIEPRHPVPAMGVDPASQFAGSVLTPSSRDLSIPGGGGNATGVSGDAVNSSSGVPVHKPGFGFDPKAPAPDFEGHRSYREFAKREIAKDAFDPGFIDSGEARQGYVYFEAPPEGVERVNLEVRLHSGEGSGPGVVVDIPYATNG